MRVWDAMFIALFLSLAWFTIKQGKELSHTKRILVVLAGYHCYE